MSKYDVLIEKVKDIFEHNGFHMTDITNPGGYFIMECDYIRHFHVKECPGYLFAIWFSEENDTGEFFGQYEKELDKFKPSYSYFNVTFSTKDEVLKPDEYSDVKSMIIPQLRFIHRHPLKAWGVAYYDYNYTTYCPASVTFDFIKYKISYYKDEIIKSVLTKICLKQYIKMAKKYAVEDDKKCYIKYSPNTNPAYDIFTEVYDGYETGCYGWSDEPIPEWDRLKKIMNKIASICHVWFKFGIEFDDCLTMYEPNDLEEFINDEELKEIGYKYIRIN